MRKNLRYSAIVILTAGMMMPTLGWAQEKTDTPTTKGFWERYAEAAWVPGQGPAAEAEAARKREEYWAGVNAWVAAQRGETEVTVAAPAAPAPKKKGFWWEGYRDPYYAELGAWLAAEKRRIAEMTIAPVAPAPVDMTPYYQWLMRQREVRCTTRSYTGYETTTCLER